MTMFHLEDGMLLKIMSFWNLKNLQPHLLSLMEAAPLETAAEEVRKVHQFDVKTYTKTYKSSPNSNMVLQFDFLKCNNDNFG